MANPNFTMRAWISFSPSSATSPTWIEITGWVQQESPITINHGRGDTLSDVGPTTCSLTVDNTDGRFLSANKGGPWFGQIDKGNWLKIEITPPSTTVSQRFVGFITSLPDEFQGETQLGQITASDRFEKLGSAPAIISSVQSEVLTDPNLIGNIQGYWNLHEAQGALTFGDTSGQGAQYMRAVGVGGVPAGTGFGASNANGPGFDGLRAATFSPASTSQGTYLTAPITAPTGTWSSGPTYTGLGGVLSFWYQATTAGLQCLASIVDPVAQFAFTIYQDHDGTLSVSYVSISPGGSIASSVLTSLFPAISDGKWHHIVVSMAATSQLSGACSITIYLDGVGVQAGWRGSVTGANGNFTQLIIGGGYLPTPFQLGAGNISDVSWYWGDLSTTTSYSPLSPPNLADHFAAGGTGFAGESTDKRIARIARYAGVPIPLTSGPGPGYGGNAQVYNPIKGPWTNLSPGAHYCGTQSMAGRKPLDIQQEAAHTENMPLYIDRSGYQAMQASTARQNTSPAWSVDVHDIDPSTRVADDFAYTTNQMTITPNALAAQTVVGGTGSPGRLSQAKYDVKDGSQSTASVNPIEAQSLGLGIIQLRAAPPPRAAPLAFEVSTTALLPGYGNAWFDAVLATEISTAVRLTNAPAALGGGNYDCLIEGWTETITAGSLMMAFNVSTIQGPTYQLDDVLLGRLDTDGTTLVGTLNTTATTFTAKTTTATSAAWTTASADFPFDVLMDAEQMTVTSIAPVSLGVDGTFETGASGWTLSNCTLTQSTAQAHSGTHSGLMTASAAGAMTATTPQFAVLAGATYQVNQWFLLGTGSPTAETVTVQWFTSGGASLGTATLPYSIKPLASWQLQQQAVTAPATAAKATISIGVTAAATGNTVYLDDVSFPLLTGGQQVFTVTRSVNGVVASHAAGAAVALAEPLTLAY